MLGIPLSRKATKDRFRIAGTFTANSRHSFCDPAGMGTGVQQKILEIADRVWSFGYYGLHFFRQLIWLTAISSSRMLPNTKQIYRLTTRLFPTGQTLQDSTDYRKIKSQYINLDLQFLRYNRDEFRRNIDYSVLVSFCSGV